MPVSSLIVNGGKLLMRTVIDLCRSYYRRNSMTAPAHRIEYIYTHTRGPNQMRRFLVTTAAYRCLCGEHQTVSDAGMSDSIREMLYKGGEVAVNFAEALILLHRNGLSDARRGPNCMFHVHSDRVYCETAPEEPWAA